VVYPVLTSEEMTTDHSGITSSSGIEKMPALNMPVQRLKAAILPLHLPCSEPVTHSVEILTTGKSHGKKPDRFYLNDDRGVKNVSRFEYGTWNIRGLGEKKKN